jgi:ComF family protein
MNLTGLGRRIWRAGIDLLMPPLCLSCGSRIAEPRSYCGTCWQQLSFIEEPRCPLWGEPFAFDAGPGTLSARALATPPVWSGLTAAVAFNDQAARLVHALKYHDRPEAAALMAKFMYRAALAQLSEADLLIPVPLHWLGLWRRRYNQAALLAQCLADMCKSRYAAGTLIRHRRTRSQVGLDQKERKANVGGAFSVPETARAQIAGRSIMLVDDVLTTGATADAAVHILLEAGARKVDVVVFEPVLQPGHGHM